MKKIILLIATLLITIHIGAETLDSGIPESINDSISTISDSLDVITKSIELALPDTTRIDQVYQPGDSLYVPTLEDSLAADAALLMNKEEEEIIIDLEAVNKTIQELISNYNTNRRQNLPFMYYSENYHTFWPLSANLNIKKYGFTKRSYPTSALQSWQNFSPDNLLTYENGLLKVNSYDYSELPLLTISNMVLGEDDMNHAMVSMMKGYILGIRDLNFSGSFLGQEGLWLGEQEKSANFGGHLFYKKSWGTLHYLYNQIEQDLALKKSNYNDNYTINGTDFSKEQITEHTFRFDNKFLNIGFNYSDQSFDKTESEAYQYLLNKNLEFGHTQLDLSAEYLEQKTVTDSSDASETILPQNSTSNENYTIFTMLHKSNLGVIETSNNVQYIDENENSINSSSIFNFSKPIGLLLNYSNFAQPGEEDYTKMGAGFNFEVSNSNLNLAGGIFKKNGFETNYVEAEGLVNIPMGDYNLSYAVWALAITDEQEFYPTIQTRNNLELGHNLKRDNYLRIGLNQIFCQEFLQLNGDQGTRISEAFIIDAYFALQITKYFEFQIDIKNLTSETQLFSFGGYGVNEIPGLHFNAGVSWVFLN